ncbi:hypothetical protein CDV36_015758 [Fusarium kuroshium]|uniref:Uncharacterized protein n=2 Tax=Fusarium solani species complex TaxID=232080 RepID=A0A3M2R883_9HYPO|nr:hypothetical protein CDV36_015758 [Fusarium kuroshium]RSL95517.1 hypothetical protein CEP52_012008 [Fusarium oligoseptatum]
MDGCFDGMEEWIIEGPRWQGWPNYKGGTYLLSRSGTPYGLTNGISYQTVSAAYRPVRTLSGSNCLRRS